MLHWCVDVEKLLMKAKFVDEKYMIPCGRGKHPSSQLDLSTQDASICIKGQPLHLLA